MAKFEQRFTGNFNQLLQAIETAGLSSLSATLEEKSDFQAGELQLAIRVFERFSYFGSNRVSLNVTLLGEGNQLFLSAITSGGSQAVFFKINTLGEHNFLDRFISDLAGFWR